MVRYVVLALGLLMFLVIALTLIVTAVVFLALACAVAIPLWLMTRPHLERHGLAGRKQSAMDRLKNLYVEGKIDLFEFERRVAHLLTFEH